ncbi:MAG: UDP-N-acetylmuramoyl-tripeptide--D-alanyl-D-alanine ligase [Flavobacteriaceae bacterium]|nr:UDP-N-acetylmuramoyl-tripeptide--D-alanyl-D-alanine ligase [Flavobacteriaceae bacterium]
MNLEALHKLFLQTTSICTDTRKISKNCIYFALKGENFNGNAFAFEALEKGAKYAVIDDEKYKNPNCVLVDNVLETLQKLANYHRKYLKTKIIALTGSNGKTTTKELINSVLSTTYNTTATIGNLNNHIGVPLTILSMSKETEIGIVEMGANHQKEIEFLCEIAEPDYGYITNFGKAHLEGFGGVEGVIKGKSELYTFLKSNNKVVFLNSDDSKQIELLANYRHIFSFGNYSDKLKIKFIEANPFVKLEFEDTTITSQLLGNYNFSNTASAIAIGKYFNVSNTDIKTALENYVPSNNRSQIIIKGSNKIILDAYNANPTSMRAALDNFEKLDDKNKIAILGDMFELGKDANKEHQAIADLTESLTFDKLFLVGKNFNKTNNQNTFNNFESLKKELINIPLKNSTILIKGSRGMALERLLEIIK